MAFIWRAFVLCLAYVLFLSQQSFCERHTEEETQCLSRFDHDYKVMQTLVRLDEKQNKFKEALEKLNKKHDLCPGLQCPDGWIVFGDSCYLFAHSKMPFYKAENFCRQYGAHLVKIETAPENNFIKEQVRNSKVGDAWIGLTDQKEEGTWRWLIDETLPTYTDFHPSQPNNGRVSNCASYYAKLGYNWVDEPCSTSYQPVCELISRR